MASASLKISDWNGIRRYCYSTNAYVQGIVQEARWSILPCSTNTPCFILLPLKPSIDLDVFIHLHPFSFPSLPNCPELIQLQEARPRYMYNERERKGLVSLVLEPSLF